MGDSGKVAVVDQGYRLRSRQIPPNIEGGDSEQSTASSSPTSHTDERVTELIARLKENPMAWAMYEQANTTQQQAEGSKISVAIVTKKELSGAPGVAFFETSELKIYDSLPRWEQLSTLVFELANFIHASRFNTLDDQVWEGKSITRTQYIRDKESIEFRTVLLHHEVVKEGILNNSWDPRMDMFADWAKHRFDYVFKHKMSPQHKEACGRHWDLLQKAKREQETP